MKRTLFMACLLLAGGANAGNAAQPLTHVGEVPAYALAQAADTTVHGSWARLDRHRHERYLRFAVGANFLEPPFGQQVPIDTAR